MSAALSGLDLSQVDPTRRPQDDLFGHVNGAWLRDHAIPPDRSGDGSFLTLRDRAEEDVRAIVDELAEQESAAGSESQQIGALYASFMNEDRIEELGLDAIAGHLRELAQVESKAELAAVLGRPDAAAGLIAPFVWNDAKDSSRRLVILTQDGIGLPDESYYREDSYAEIREAYVAHLARLAEMARLVPEGEGVAIAQRVMDLETRIAALHWNIVDNRDSEKTYNLRTWEEFTSLAPGFDWTAWRDATGAPAGAFAEVVVSQPSFVEDVSKLWSRADLTTLRLWALLHQVASYAPYLSSEFALERFDFAGRTLTGAEQQRDRWKRGVALVEGFLGEALGKRYVDRHFPPENKAAIDVLVANIIEAYRVSITDLEWMTPTTREKALEKLAKFTPKVGYPESWRDYSGLVLDQSDLIGNLRRAQAFEAAHEFAKVGQPIDKREWLMTPQTVNAYYNPSMNEIVFPAAILQPPFFDPHADDAANYGGIAAVIGHEIGHGFDDQGSKFDGDGNLVSWWTDEDREAFESRTKRLIEQYDALVPVGLDSGHHVNGALTIGENIGDLGGLTIALTAYDVALSGSPAPEIDGFTGSQRVFFGWAQVWRAKNRREEAIRRLAIDPHSPNEFRCNQVLRNLTAFHTAFDVGEGDDLYLPPEDRVSIW